MPPAYYDYGDHNVTSNATGNTETNRYLLLTPAAGATSRAAYISGLFANGQNNGAGGGYVIATTWGTAGAGGTGTARTPNKTQQDQEAAASLTISQTPQTAGSGTRTDRITVGWAQTGGQGGWIAQSPDAAKRLSVGGGANGNMELRDLANAASQLYTFMVEFWEG